MNINFNPNPDRHPRDVQRERQHTFSITAISAIAVAILIGNCLSVFTNVFPSFNHSPICPTLELACNESNLASKYNYLCRDGSHTSHSVVLGAKRQKFLSLKKWMYLRPILKDLAIALHENPLLIPLSCKEMADQLANKIYSQSIDPYRHCGLNETNAIGRYHRTNPPKEMDQRIYNYLQSHILEGMWTIQVHTRLEASQINGFYLPRSLALKSQIMLLEQTADNFQNMQFGIEDTLVPSLVNLVHIDEIYKKCHGLELNKALLFKTEELPIGRIANCFRRLMEFYNDSYAAASSSYFVRFINHGFCSTMSLDQFKFGFDTTPPRLYLQKKGLS